MWTLIISGLKTSNYIKNMKQSIFSIAVCLSLLIGSSNLSAQDKLYPNTFSLQDVTLLEGPFRHALDLNIEVLLQYDVDRLLAPFLKEAGLPAKAESFPNWVDLDGHVGGHYLSSLAIHYAATGNKECEKRMNYMLSELKRCQLKNGNGYVGGVPHGAHIWNEIKNGNPGIVRQYWVPWYNLHKTFAGLRDAWVYGGSNEARQMFLDLCKWGLTIVSPLSDEQMEIMLANEFGGINEVYADAYQMTGEEAYLTMAKRFSHKEILDNMAAHRDNLDNKHANTQVPKAVGYQRTAEVSGDSTQTAAAKFFWETVVNNRSLSFGGNSRREHFPSYDDCESYMEDREGPESCNTNNMLKLTEGLFRMNPDAKYADFYERAMYNHILSTQHPEHGGYVYFTPARPAHYRVYSAPNSAMWCCVGTGMENHGKYGQFIYNYSENNLYVNLFVASQLSWKEKGITLIQNTSFPNEERTTLTVRAAKAKKFNLLIRRPWWVKPEGMQITCNGKKVEATNLSSSYVSVNRKWKDGDAVEISLPMKVTIEELPNVSKYISILRGPILLAARTNADNMTGLVADDQRWSHIAHGPLVSIYDTPILIGTRTEIQTKLDAMQPVASKPFSFTVPQLFTSKDNKKILLEPFYQIHDSRYMMYWLSATEEEYATLKQEREAIEKAKLLLDSRTVDAVNTGEQQPEVDHLMQTEHSNTGIHEGETWRDARNGGFFQYTLRTKEQENLSLMVRYWGNDHGNRTFDILIDNELLITENIVNKWNVNKFVNEEYSIPDAMVKGKEFITLTFRAHKRNIAGGISLIRLLELSK